MSLIENPTKIFGSPSNPRPIPVFYENFDTFSGTDRYGQIQSPDKKQTFGNVFCGNCGRRGHLYRECTDYITSFGVIAIRKQDNCKNKDALVILLVQRKDTMGYVDFIRGRYSMRNSGGSDVFRTDRPSKQLLTLFEEMIPSEREKIQSTRFDKLWDDLWINHNCKCYKNEREYAKQKFESVDIMKLLSLTADKTKWTTTEYGIPKGRRNMKETNFECAQREFREETGYTCADYMMISHRPYLEEIFIGTNGKRYKHIYYLAHVYDTAREPCIDRENKNQIGEIKSVDWLTQEEALPLIREYDIEKKRIIKRVFSDFGSFQGDLRTLRI